MDNVEQEELFDEILTYLMAALSVCGVRDSKMQDALDVYEDILNTQDDDINFDYKDIAKIILNLKNTHKELFH